MNKQKEWIYTIDEIDDFVRDFLIKFNDKRIICINGNLGAGKTTLIKAFCNQLGSTDDVTSPTFSIINNYRSPNGDIHHFDLYRLKNTEEILLDTGIEEYLYSGNYCFIEWFDKIKNILPANNVVICELNIINTKTRRLTANTF